MAEQAGSRQKNRQVAEMLDEIGELLEIKGEVRFKYNAYHVAARRIESMPEPIEKLHAEKRLKSIQGVGAALDQKIGEFLDTGSLGYLERLREQIPPSLLSLIRVPGMGPKKAYLVYQRLGVTDVEQLEQAIRDKRLNDSAGLGEKTAETIRREIERAKERSQRHMLSVALDRAEVLLAELRRHPSVLRAEYAGSLRRRMDSVGDLDLLVTSGDPAAVHQLV